MPTSILYIASFIVTLGVLILFHELGHFLIARLFGVGVEKFSVGFGPRLFGKTVGITEYRVSAIPLGGYVKMIGEDPDSEVDPETIPISFTHKHVFKRILIVAAGPAFNLLLAALIFFGIFLSTGIYILKPVVGKLEPGSPAFKAGLKQGDLIVAIDDRSVETWEEMSKVIKGGNGSTMTFTVDRKGERLIREIRPSLKPIQNLFGEARVRYVIGISSAGEGFIKELNPFQAFFEGVIQTYRLAELTVVSIVKLIQGTVSAKTLGGPIMIAEMAGQQAKLGIGNYTFFLALLSINLAILNFLPIPVLDGGHLFFFLIEMIIRRPVNVRFREIAQQVGLFVIILLMAFVIYNDIARMILS